MREDRITESYNKLDKLNKANKEKAKVNITIKTLNLTGKTVVVDKHFTKFYKPLKSEALISVKRGELISISSLLNGIKTGAYHIESIKGFKDWDGLTAYI